MTPDEKTFVDRLRRAYAPPPMEPVEQRRFDARLRARIEDAARRRRRWLVGGAALAAAAAAAALFALASPDAGAPGPPAPAIAAPTEPAAGEAIALDWLVEEPAADAEWLGRSTVIPADPLAVAGLEAATAEAAETDTETEAGAADEAAAPEWMPAEYEMLAMLIDVDPYMPEEDWP